jgi:hypothetical protein
MRILTIDSVAIEYTKTCKDFGYLGVECCDNCHGDPDNHLDVVQVNGEPALLCCKLRMFFYPEGADSKLSPEERLLRAIFGESCGRVDPQQFD